jgi:hypothetical protein
VQIQGVSLRLNRLQLSSLKQPLIRRAARATFSHKGPVALSAFEAEDVRREGSGRGNWRLSL